MKKIPCLLLLTLILVGCSSMKQKREEALLKAGTDYFETYGKKLVVNEYFVTLEQLEDANLALGKDYDLKVLEDCKKDTTVTFTLKDMEIQDVTYKINCN